jgi:putative DNA primase/helicase
MLDFNREPKPDPLQSFLDQIEQAGLGRPLIQGTGEIERFDTPDCKKGEKAGWAVLYLDKDFAAGAFGSWRNGKGQSWANSDTKVSRDKIKELQAKAEKVRVEKNEDARVKALALWDRSPPAENHPYLTSKGVKPLGIRQSGNRLIIPMMDINGNIHSVQEIFPDGKKKNFPGGAVKGFFYKIPGDKPTYLVEGFATGSTVHSATGSEVIITFSCGNLKEVAKLFPDSIIAADND